jgi:hypothetical protein
MKPAERECQPTSNRIGRKTAGRMLRSASIIGLVAATMLAAYHFAAVARTYWPIQTADFGAFYRGAMAVSMGQSPYDLEGLRQMPYGAFYKYPPLFAIALAPLARLGYMPAWHIWFVISLILYLATLLLLAHVESLSPRRPWFWLLALAFFLFQPSLDTLFGGQLEFLLLFLFTAAYAALRARPPAGPAIAGISIALGTLLKLFPILFVPWLLAKHFRAAVWVGVGLLALTLFSAAAGGWPLQVQYLTQVLPGQPVGTAWLENQAYFGFFARLWVNGAAVDGSYATQLPAAIWLSRAASVVTYVLSLAVLLRVEHPRHGFTVLLPCMLLVMPAAWIHYETIMLLPFGIFLAGFAKGSRPIPPPLLLVAFVLLAFGNESLVQGARAGLMQSYKFYGVFLMWVLAMAWAWRDRLEAPKLAWRELTPRQV